MVTHLPAHHNPAGKKIRSAEISCICYIVVQYYNTESKNARSDGKGRNGRRMRENQRPISGRVG